MLIDNYRLENISTIDYMVLNIYNYKSQKNVQIKINFNIFTAVQNLNNLKF